MSENAQLNVIVLGNKFTVIRLSACFQNDGINLVGRSAMSEVVSLLHQKQFDAVLVDSLLEEADTACSYISKMSCVPVALLVRGREINWKKLNSWEVDGFIFEGSSDIEIIARIKALSRRREKVCDGEG